MTEAELEEAVRDLCALFQLYRYHPHDSRRSAAGWPDDAIIGPHGILFRELKSADGETTAEQAQVIWLLHQAGADAAVWRPHDLISGRIEAELRAIR